jgi:hypothetical protein
LYTLARRRGVIARKIKRNAKKEENMKVRRRKKKVCKKGEGKEYDGME